MTRRNFGFRNSRLPSAVGAPLERGQFFQTAIDIFAVLFAFLFIAITAISIAVPFFVVILLILT
jgi:hypothetical protein